MSRPMGIPKSGGRKKGTPNKKTVDLESALKNAGIDVVAELGKTLPVLSDDVKIKVLIELMSFLYPKRKAVEFSEHNQGQTKSISIEFVGSDGRGSPFRDSKLKQPL